MITAAIMHPSYFVFGSERDLVPEGLGLHDISSPQSLIKVCDSAYRLFYCCLPLYDRVVSTPLLRPCLSAPQSIRGRPGGKPTVEVCPGIVLLKQLVDQGVATFADQVDGYEMWGAEWKTDAERDAMRREFISPISVEVIVRFFPFVELSCWYEDAQKWISEQPDEVLNDFIVRITAYLRGEKSLLSCEESDVTQAVNEVLSDLAEFRRYISQTDHDVYAYSHYMPLLLAHAVHDKKDITGLRSFSLVLPVVDTPESYSQAHGSFSLLRRAIEEYQQALTTCDEEQIGNTYMKLDNARHQALKQEFDPLGCRELVTVTCLMTTVGERWKRHFLPDDHFRLSLAMQHWRYLSADQAQTFQVMLDAVLLAIRDLSSDSRVERVLLASCACQPLLDFVVLSQCARLGIVEPPDKPRVLGRRWGDIKQKIQDAGGMVGKPLEHLGKCVLDRRNAMSHPAQKPKNVQQSRGEVLSDLCRLVDFIRFLDCSMPPTT